MKLSEKLELLRSLEGNLRGLKRALTKSEVARLVEEESEEKISVAYLSQLESGKRTHMTETTRELLANFYKVHPGFFVSDPEGYDTNVTSVRLDENLLDSWLVSGARQFCAEDPDLAHALRVLAEHEASRTMLLLLGEIVQNPELLGRLRSTLTNPPVVSNGASPQIKPAPTKKGKVKT